VKTTIEIPDVLFRRVKSKAAERSQSLKEFVSEALQEKLARRGAADSAEPAWMQGFGKLRMLHKETERIQESIHEAFEALEPEDRT
jgi:predicted transcriptional regulator